MAKKSIGNSGGGRFKPISRAEIVYAQSNTKSNRQAAKFLGVGMARYKRYAKIYNLYDSHANPLGIGTNKGFARRSSTVPLRDVFANKHPRYSVIRLKNRMVARKMLVNECAMCGFCEKRMRKQILNTLYALARPCKEIEIPLGQTCYDKYRGWY